MYGFVRADLKQRAKYFLKDYYFYALVVCVIYSIQNMLSSGISFNINLDFDIDKYFGVIGSIFKFAFAGVLFLPLVLLTVVVSLILSIFIFPALEVGMAKYFIGDKQDSISDVFFVFKSSHYFNVVKTVVLKNIFIYIGYACLVIPGVIMQYRWCMTKYILAKHPDMGFSEVLHLSSLMTRGKCVDIFVLDLSFILWHILVGFLGKIGSILLLPYIEATYAQLFFVLKDESEEYLYASAYQTDY